MLLGLQNARGDSGAGDFRQNVMASPARPGESGKEDRYGNSGRGGEIEAWCEDVTERDYSSWDGKQLKMDAENGSGAA